MNVRWLFLISFFSVLCVSSFAQSDSDYLTVRQMPGSQAYEAVLTLDNSVCVQVNAVSSVQIVGSEVLIESQWNEQLPCIAIPPIITYEKTAYIGDLAPGRYTVTWNQEENFSWSTSLFVPGPIPSSSPWALLLLILGILAIVHPVVRSKIQLR
jgi:hypothetical protein